MDRHGTFSTYVFSVGAWKAWLSLAFLAACSLERVCVGLVSPCLDARIMDLYYFVSMPKLMLEATSAYFLVDWIFKWFGRSWSGKVVEIRGPARAQRPASADKSDVHELPCPGQLLSTRRTGSASLASALRSRRF